MFDRFIESHIHVLAGLFPVTLILGPRQCGKTTLAKRLGGGSYFDLERPSDVQVFAPDIEGALRRFPEPLILDEAQRLPELFSVLRSVVDEKREVRGRFILLGSVDPSLKKEVSESLAGRIGIAELTPLLFREIRDIPLSRYWLKGGFPDALLTADQEEWTLWQANYIRTFGERDLARFGSRQSPEQMYRLLAMLAAQQGGLLNASALGRSLGMSYHAVERLLDLFEGHFLIRRLAPYFAHVGKRLTKSPKIYIRDSGLAHHLVGITGEDALHRAPIRGFTWEGLVIEQIIAAESIRMPSTRFYFYRTQTGQEVDLLIDYGQHRLGLEIKCSTTIDADAGKGLRAALQDGVINRAMIVYQGRRSFEGAEGIRVCPAEHLFEAESLSENVLN